MTIVSAAADVIRFGMYAATQLGLPAAILGPLTWLRYNAFLILCRCTYMAAIRSVRHQLPPQILSECAGRQGVWLSV